MMLRWKLRKERRKLRHQFDLEGACPVCRAWHREPEDCMAYRPAWHERKAR